MHTGSQQGDTLSPLGISEGNLMQAHEFEKLQHELGVSRAKMCKMLGIAPNTGTAYSKGRSEIPLTVALACAALKAGLDPYGAEQEAPKPKAARARSSRPPKG